MPLHVAIRTTGALRDVLGPRRALALPDDATVDRGRALADGDEVALILPVAGGSVSPRAPR